MHSGRNVRIALTFRGGVCAGIPIGNHGESGGLVVGDLKGQQRDGSGGEARDADRQGRSFGDEEHGLDGLVAQRHRPVGSLGWLQDRASPDRPGAGPHQA